MPGSPLAWRAQWFAVRSPDAGRSRPARDAILSFVKSLVPRPLHALLPLRSRKPNPSPPAPMASYEDNGNGLVPLAPTKALTTTPLPDHHPSTEDCHPACRARRALRRPPPPHSTCLHPAVRRYPCARRARSGARQSYPDSAADGRARLMYTWLVREAHN